MNVFQSCSNFRDAVELYRPQGLYLKPAATLNISVQLPVTKLPGKNISNWEVMEKLKHMIKPEEFMVLKVSKSTVEFIRFEGEIENKSKLPDVLKKIDMKSIKLSGFPELLKLRAAELKLEFPTRHTWDSFFRDAKNMNEMKSGERPDTLHISNLPCKWFSAKHKRDRDNSDKPDEYIFRKVFEKFGEIRFVDIPMCDPYRNMMKAHISGVKMFSFGQDHLFEGYVQYTEYMGFVKAMDALRGMKLLNKDGDKNLTASFKVEFDKTKHLSDASIRRRKIEREKLMALEREQDEKERIKEELQEAQKEKERLALEEAVKSKSERRKQREEKRMKKQLKILHAKEAEMMNKKIATEERKLLLAQRQLESIRLLDFLFERVKEKKQKDVVKKKEKAIDKKFEKIQKKKEKKLKKKELKAKLKKEKLEDKEKKLRNKLVRKFETVQEREMEEQREKLRKTIEGKNKLKSVLAATCAQVSKTEPASNDNAGPSQPLPLLGQPILMQGNPMLTMNPNFQGAPGYSGNGFPIGPQWYPTPNGAFGYFENMPGYQPPFFNYGFPNPGFQPRGGFFPRRSRGSWGPRRPRGFRRGGWHPNQYYNDSNTEEYYNYFKNLSKDGKRPSRSRSYSRSRSRSHSRSRRSRSGSRRRSYSRSRSRSRRHSRSRRSRSRSRSYSRTRSGSRRSRTRSKSDSRKRSRTRSRSREKSHSRSRSKSPSNRTKKHSSTHSHNRSPTEHRSRTKSRSHSRHRRLEKSRSHSRTKPQSNELHEEEERPISTSKSLTKKPVIDTGQGQSRVQSKHQPRNNSRSRSHSKAWSDGKPRARSRSWSQRQSRSPSLSKISSASLSAEDTPKLSANGVIKQN